MTLGHPARLLLMAALALPACGDKDDTSAADDTSTTDDTSVEGDADADTDSDSDTDVPQSTAAGDIELRDGSAEGSLDIAKAFSFYSNRMTFIYASSNPAATCAKVAELFDPESRGVDRTDLFVPGGCNISISMVGPPPVETYDLQDESRTGGIINLTCAFGDGAWEYDANAAFPDYYWTGEYFQAAAWRGTFDIAFRDEGAHALVSNLALDQYRGTFPHSEDRTGEFLASGSVRGTIEAVECEGMEATGWF